MFNPVLIIYENSGDIGLIFFLIIISLNIPALWGTLPQKIHRENERDGDVNWRIWQWLLKINWLVFPIIFSVLAIQIILIPGPALWVRILSGVVAIVLFILLVASTKRVLINESSLY